MSSVHLCVVHAPHKLDKVDTHEKFKDEKKNNETTMYHGYLFIRVNNIRIAGFSVFKKPLLRN